MSASLRADQRIERMRQSFPISASVTSSGGIGVGTTISAQHTEALLDALSTDLRHKENILQDLKNELKALEAENDRTNHENNVISESVTTASELNQQLEDRYRTLHDENIAMEAQISALHKANTECQSNKVVLQHLRSQAESLQREESELRKSVLERSRQIESDRIENMVTSLRDVLHVATGKAAASTVGAGQPTLPHLESDSIYHPSVGRPISNNNTFFSPSRTMANRSASSASSSHLFSNPELERSVQQLLYPQPPPPTMSPPPLHSLNEVAVPTAPTSGPSTREVVVGGDVPVSAEVHSRFVSLQTEYNDLMKRSGSNSNVASSHPQVFQRIQKLEDMLHQVRMLKILV
eukprot:PhF_6_TR25111/c1_g1_i2/m.34521